MAEQLAPAQVQELAGQLRELLRQLREQLQAQPGAARPVALDQQSFGRVSRIDAIQQQQMALAGRDQALQQLRQVSRALERVDSGDYGYCVECDEAIGYPRLRARPYSPCCLRCQSRSEQ